MPKHLGFAGLSRNGSRPERAARLRAELEAKRRQAEAKSVNGMPPSIQTKNVVETIAERHGQTQTEIKNQSFNTASQKNSQASDLRERNDTREVPKADGHEKDMGGNGPVGTGDHVVKQGECISSIAKDTGHFWETIWNDPANTELREVRRCPNVLLPDDRVTIPVIQPKQEPGETEMRHRFRMQSDRVWLRIALKGMDDLPLTGRSYKLEVGTRTYEGVTDGQGVLDHEIPASAKTGKLITKEREYALKISHLNPVDEVSGWKARLSNLGYAPGEGDGVNTLQVRSAVEEFQCDNGLQVDGIVGPKTTAKLVEVHGC